ncbi:hypothetical protein OAA18_00145 [bacterium]|nr:hypothetical protein [bacterium]
MANVCRTDIKIQGSKEAISYFKEKYESCHDGKYPNEEEAPHIVDVFGADSELFIDKVGSKWVTQYEIFWDDETSYEFGLESANYPPSDMLKEIHRQLVAIDPDITFTARYWDEAYDPIGVIKITDAGQYLELEDYSLEEDDQEYFWDDVIEPAFERLEEKLNIA